MPGVESLCLDVSQEDPCQPRTRDRPESCSLDGVHLSQHTQGTADPSHLAGALGDTNVTCSAKTCSEAFAPRRSSHRGLLFLALAIAPFARADADVILNEIHYAPDVETEAVEFVELYNRGTHAVRLTGWSFTEGITFEFPADTTVEPDGYLVVAQDPAALAKKYGAAALGPWTGRLTGRGERIVLRDAAGAVVDEVEYQSGFPWPTVGEAPGYSIELIHPALDNDLGGSWRPSIRAGAPPADGLTLIEAGSTWRFRKGSQAPSSPVTAWRKFDFDDSSWTSGALPIGYDPALTFGTRLSDMRGQYSSVFLRRTFEVEDPSVATALTLDVLYDDGFKLWINGNILFNENISTQELAFSATASTARESNAYATLTVNSLRDRLLPGTNLITVQLHNSSLSESTDCFFDLRLTAETAAVGRGPTPGRLNAAWATNAPPQIRQVDHDPNQPRSGDSVVLTARVTDPDGVQHVQLEYQLVDPGAYVELTDAAYATNWIAVPMTDDGSGADAVGGDHLFTAALGPDIQKHRRLVRYRLTAEDALGANVLVPYSEDPQPNFAYFVYDGVPAWTGSVKPGDTGALGRSFTVDATEMNRLPVIQLIGKKATIETSTWFSRYTGDAYLWLGTLVYDGHVYDHIHHRARGGMWRYSMCKNMWKFDLNRGHDLVVRDPWGRKLNTPWTKLNLGASIQQGDYQHRGEQGMFEALGFRMFQLAGVPACHTVFAQLRIIDDTAETPTTDQYEGDFWGVYLMTEQENGRFLEEHGLADGNFYKMESGTGELNHLGLAGPDDKSDLNAFLSAQGQADESWWRAHLNVPCYLSYQTVVQAIHHYDISDGKNYFYYFEPETQQVTVAPWDLDLSWAENMYNSGGGGVDAVKQRLLPTPARFPAVWLEWQSRIREFRDLFFNEDEAWRLIDEFGGRLRGPADAPSILDADRAQWDYNPKMIDSRYTDSPGSKAGQGRYYRWPLYGTGITRDFNGCLQIMKRYVSFRSTNSTALARALDLLAADATLPATPALAYDGPASCPVNRLRFRVSAFAGSNPLRSLRCRIGEITRPSAPSWQADEPWKYEIETVWDSGEIAAATRLVEVPAGFLSVGHAYRARAQFADSTGRTSHWSPPVEFVAGEADYAADLQCCLRLTELMFHPPAGSDHEFLELWNASPTLTLELGGVAFTDGIQYVFPAGSALAPGAHALVVPASPGAGFEAIRTHYGLSPDVALFGPWDGALANDGETVTLNTADAGEVIASFAYGDGRGWPAAADGAGHSLVPLEADTVSTPTLDLQHPLSWRASSYLGGSPGQPDPVPPPGLQITEIGAQGGLTNNAGATDWLELGNTGATVSFGPGWYLADSPDNLRRWPIPADAPLASGERCLFPGPAGSTAWADLSMTLDREGDAVYLSYLPGTGEDRVVDAIRFEGQESGLTESRHPTAHSHWVAAPPSPTAPNNLPPRWPFISELMYHPTDALSGTNLVDNTLAEFIEIAVPSPADTDLRTTTHGPWQLAGDIEFVFPDSFALAATERVAVVRFDPADPVALADFRASLGLGDEPIRLVGPFQGRLGNRTGRVVLQKPVPPSSPGTPSAHAIVDEVLYGEANPWPDGADGTGLSLHRKFSRSPGNDPASWLATSPTPSTGAPGSAHNDFDHDGLPNGWEDAHGLSPFSDSGEDGATGDPDHDGLDNQTEHALGTPPEELTLHMLGVAPGNDGIRLVFLVPALRDLRVEYRADLAAGPWLTLTNVLAGSVPQSWSVTDPAIPPEGRRYYRLAAP